MKTFIQKYIEIMSLTWYDWAIDIAGALSLLILTFFVGYIIGRYKSR